MTYKDLIKRLEKEGYVISDYLKNIFKLLDEGKKLNIHIPRKNNKSFIYKK